MPDREALSEVRAVLLDIEGTIAPISYVFDVLFPFARSRLAGFLAANATRPDVIAARQQVARDAGRPDLADAASSDVAAHLAELMDRDVKATGLKAIQGLIWEEGYAAGALRSELFADVAPALRRWHAAGLRLWIYSSGSIAAQRVFLRHTRDGDLTPLIRGYFDTTTGPKQSPDSYRSIAAATAGGVRPDTHHSAAPVAGPPDSPAAPMPPTAILFLSDIVPELDAASIAGMQTGLALRPGNRPVGPHHHATLRSLDDLALSAPEQHVQRDNSRR